MHTYIQLLSLISSFIFGIFFSILTNLNYKYIFSKNVFYKIFFNLIFIIDIVLLYMLLILKINGGIFHIYFIFMVIIGYLLSYKKVKVLIKNVKLKLSIAKKKSK